MELSFSLPTKKFEEGKAEVTNSSGYKYTELTGAEAGRIMDDLEAQGFIVKAKVTLKEPKEKKDKK